MVKLELLILNPLKLISEFWMNRTIKDFLVIVKLLWLTLAKIN